MIAPLSVAVHARTAVAGNPSDGYGGAVVSVPVPQLAATATVVSSGSPADAPELELVAATRRRFALAASLASPAQISIETTIPRSVGLAGSSAIVIATLRVLAGHHGVVLAPMEIATLAHTIEREDLGIAGGWQDQVIQSHGVPLLMEFAEPMRQRVLQTTALPLWIAWSTEAGEPSGDSHRDLRSREHEVTKVMAELADVARRCAHALDSNDGHTVKECINATFDLRREIMPIAAAHDDMIMTARSAGSAANFAGSGGAIIGVVPKEPNTLFAALTAAGYDHLHWTPSEQQIHSKQEIHSEQEEHRA